MAMLVHISDVQWCKHGRRAIKKHQKLCEICSPAELELCRVSGSLQPGEGIDCGLRRLIRLPHWHTPRHTRHRRHRRWQGSEGSECAAFPVRADERWQLRHGLSQMWGLTGRIGGGSTYKSVSIVSVACPKVVHAYCSHSGTYKHIGPCPHPLTVDYDTLYMWYLIRLPTNIVMIVLQLLVAGGKSQFTEWMPVSIFISRLLSIYCPLSLSVTDKKCINQEC